MQINGEVLDYLASRDNRLERVIASIGPISIRSHNDPFAFLVHEVVEQMLSAKVANRIVDRLSDMCCGHISPESILLLSAEELRATGMSYRKANTILSFALRYDENEFANDANRNDSEVIDRICKMEGFGPWTAKMYLIFCLGREDVLPYEDGAFLQSYRWLYNARSIKPNTIKRRCAAWKPYSSIAARYLYRALDTGLTKIPVSEFLNR